MTKGSKTKSITPPYLSITKLEKVMGLVSSRNFSKISIETFRNYGFGQFDAQLAISLLRFLNLIDDEGVPTESISKLYLPSEARKQEFEKILKNAYRKLFELIAEPQNLSSDELLSDFRIQYGLSDRLAKAAVPTFIKLCELGGLKEEGTIVGRVRQPSHKSNEQTAKSQSPNGKRPTAEHPQITEAGAVINTITMTLSDDLAVQYSTYLNNRITLDDELNQKWRALIKDLQSIADKTRPKEKLDSE